MIVFFLKLLLAHLAGDFLLQPRSWVEKRKTQVAYLLLHIAVHAGLLVLLFLPELSVRWPLIVFLVCAHLVIDSFKILMERIWQRQSFRIFWIDQVLHLITLFAITVFQYGFPPAWWTALISVKSMLYVIALLLIACVSPVVLRLFFFKWEKEKELHTKAASSLVDAGLLIGIMERLMIVLFIQIGFLSGIGFLLAAKSIFRFGDLAKAKDTKFTEYVLLGTLASFVMGIAIGYALLLSIRKFA